MKYFAATAALLATGIAAYFLWLPGTAELPEPTAQGNALAPAETPNDVAKSTPTTSHEAMEDQRVPYTLADLLAQQETEVVFGMEVLKDRNCDVREHYLENGDGTVSRAVSCEPRSPRAGPYDHYSNETLAIMAGTDSMAAYDLGRRLLTDDPRAGTRYMLRAVALDNLPADRPARLSPIWEVVNERFKADAVIHGDPTAMKNMHLFYTLGERIDPEYDFYTDQSRQLLIDAGFSTSEIAEIENRSELYLENMDQLRREVLGEPLELERRL